jgi:hypothetical protein
MNSKEVDDRLSAVERSVRAGKFQGDTPWRPFKDSYFRLADDDEARELMKAWGKRHGISVSWRKGKFVGFDFEMEWLELK